MSYFNYNVDAFERLTPVQAFQILRTKREIDDKLYLLIRSEFRRNNYITIASGFSGTRIRTERDLYPLPTDKIQQSLTEEKLKRLANKPLTPEERKLLGL